MENKKVISRILEEDLELTGPVVDVINNLYNLQKQYTHWSLSIGVSEDEYGSPILEGERLETDEEYQSRIEEEQRLIKEKLKRAEQRKLKRQQSEENKIKQLELELKRLKQLYGK